jgi:hypothetical protein
MAEQQTGKIITPPHVYLERHELETASVFADLGKDVEFLKPSRTRGAKTPDIIMDGLLWEMKSPTGNGKKTVEKQLQRAGKQSKHIIFDARRTALTDEYIEKEIRRQLLLSRSLKQVILITKTAQTVAIKRK